MNSVYPLMQREWMQHRFGWLLLLAIPLGLALLLVAFGQVHIESNDIRLHVGAGAPAALAVGSIAATTIVMFVILWTSSLIIVSGLARRDLGDRSIEFWLSLPTDHSQSIAVPMVVHLLLVPAVALAVGMAGGYLISMAVVGRLFGFDAWLALPWSAILPASLVALARLLIGLPLATLWIAPLVLLIVLMTAWFKRWAWVILGVGMGLGGYLMKVLFGQPLLTEVTKALIRHSARALIGAGGQGLEIDDHSDPTAALLAVPGWLLSDFGAALRDLASPLLVGGLVFAAACFALLVSWRQRGAGATS